VFDGFRVHVHVPDEIQDSTSAQLCVRHAAMNGSAGADIIFALPLITDWCLHFNHKRRFLRAAKEHDGTVVPEGFALRTEAQGFFKAPAFHVAHSSPGAEEGTEGGEGFFRGVPVKRE